jgi:hypothetical protein
MLSTRGRPLTKAVFASASPCTLRFGGGRDLVNASLRPAKRWPSRVVMAPVASSAVAYCMYAYLAKIDTKSILMSRRFVNAQNAKGREKVN